MFEKVRANKNNAFYPVSEEMILNAESNMGIVIPDSLKTFFKEIGYGFIETRKHNINRIMGPSSIEEFFFGTGQFEYSEETSIFEEFTKDKMVFFEVNESLYLSIGTTKNNKNKIYYYDEVIADSLEQFLNKYSEDENYFLS